jgi:hypothetical protein
MRRSFLVGLVPVLAFATVSFASTREAHAGPIIGLDFDLGTAFQNQVDFSTGGGLRLGYRFGIPGSWLYLQPELGGKYMRFGIGDANTIGYDYAGIVNGGLKIGLSGVVQPNIFGHLGLGIMGYNDNGQSVGYVGPEADVGAGLDFRVVPGFLLGAQIAYNSIAVPAANSPDAAKWVSFGINATFHIGEPRPRPIYVQPVYYRRY